MTTRIARTLQSGIAALAAAFITSFPVFAAPHTYTPYSVVPIFFVPTDWRVNSKEVKAEAADLQQALTNVQSFYRREVGGTTFVLDQIQVVKADFAKESYGITWGSGDIYAPGVITVGPSFESLVVNELDRRGFPIDPTQNESGFTFAIFVKGAGNYTIGREYSPGDGGWMLLGDWAIDGIQN